MTDEVIEPIKKEFELMFATLQLIKPNFDTITKAKMSIACGSNNANTILKRTLEELLFSEKILSDYLIESFDERFVKHLIEIINGLSVNVRVLITENKLNEQTRVSFENIHKIAVKIVEFLKVISGEIDKEYFYKHKITEGRKVYKELGVNDPCPCGSGKKYKKCCK